VAKFRPLGVVPLGDCAAYVEFSRTLDLEVNSMVQRLAVALRSRGLPWLRDVVPALGGVALHFDPAFEGNVLELAAELAAQCLKKGLPAAKEFESEIELPVCYEAEFAPDIDEVSKRTGLAAGEVVKILQREMDRQSKDLSNKENALADFKNKNGILSLTENDKGNIIIQRLGQLSAALTDAELDAINQKANYDAARLMLADPVQREDWLLAQHTNTHADFNDDSASRDVAKWEAYLTALQRQYSPNHPYIQNAEAALAQAKKQLAIADSSLIDGYLATLKQTYEKTLQRKGDLKTAFDAQQKAALELNSAAVQEAKLEDDVKQSVRMVDLLDQRLKEMSVTKDSNALNALIVEPEYEAAWKQAERAFQDVLKLALSDTSAERRGKSIATRNSFARTPKPSAKRWRRLPESQMRRFSA